MFTYIYETIYPLVGSIIGYIVRFANIDVHSFVDIYSNATVNDWIPNVMTGEPTRLVIDWTSNAFGSLLWGGRATILSLLRTCAESVGMYEAPMWVFYIVFGVTYYVLIRLAIKLLR